MITVSLPIAAPTNLQATLQAGGSLAANTTYYYIVIAYDATAFSPGAIGSFNFHGPISDEGTFTTDTTNLSVKINWDNVPGATRYQILVSTISGDYTNSGGYGTAVENVGGITSGVTGYTITALSTEIYAFHHIQLKNTTVGNIPKNLGLLKVSLSGVQNHTLQQVYDAIVAAGYSDYCVYDGYTFILKGWIMVENTVTDAGSLVVERKNLIFVKGGVSNRSSAYIIRFGRLISELAGADYSMGCNIDLQNSRYPFYGQQPSGVPIGNLRVYGCNVTFGNSIKTELVETKNKNYYLNAAGGTAGNASFTVDILNFIDNILGLNIRNQSSRTKDLKMAQGNNWGNLANIRLRVTTTVAMPYSSTPEGFYACKFLTYPTKLSRYAGSALHNHSGYNVNFYDCEFPSYPNGMIDASGFAYTNILVSDLYSDAYQTFLYSISATVLDEQGNALSGVNVSAKDSNGNDVIWIEHDTTIDKMITGNTFVGDVSTDANGQIDYYIKSYKIELNPLNTTYPTSSDIIKTNYYPYTITFSKDGYRDYKVILEALNKKTDMTLTLEDYEPPIYVSSQVTGSISTQSISGSIKPQVITGHISEENISGNINIEDI